MAGERRYGDGPVNRRGVPLEPGRYTLEVVRVIPSGNEYWLRLRVVEGDRAGFEFSDHCKRDERTFNVAKGTKTWNIFRACFLDTHRVIDFIYETVRLADNELRELEGRGFTAEVAIGKAGGSNYVQHRTVRALPYPGGKVRSERRSLIKAWMDYIASLPSAQ